MTKFVDLPVPEQDWLTALDEISREVATGRGLAKALAAADKTQDELIREKVLEDLRQLGGLTVGDESLVFRGNQIVLPETMRGNPMAAVTFIKGWVEAQAEKVEFSRTFQYRPMDGAHAFNQAMVRMFGTGGIGRETRTIFGKIPPQMISIYVGYGQKAQVPWGRVEYSPLEAVFSIGRTESPSGNVSQISVEAPKRYQRELEAFFDVVEAELRTNSIFRGKAINAAEEAEYLNTRSVTPDRVVYSEEVITQLSANVWSLIRHSEVQKRIGLPLKRAVLLEGPYGTGKTLAGVLTAQICEENGWTFIEVRPGRDKLAEALKTAALYSPAVVWCEDIDVIANPDGSSVVQISTMLDALDGAASKGAEVVGVFTTNHVDKIQRGAMRPGRLDAVIHIGALDASGLEKLVRVLVPEQMLDPKADFGQITAAFEGFLPAFAAEAIGRAMRYAVDREGGVPRIITTGDLVSAAHGLRPQLDLMNEAAERGQERAVETALKGIVLDAIEGTRLLDYDGDLMGSLDTGDR